MYNTFQNKVIVRQFHLEGHELTATLAAELLEALSITEFAFELIAESPLRWD